MISREEVNHIAKLARIDLNEKELRKFQGELSSILDYIKLLKQVDTGKAEPCFHPHEGQNIMRGDKARPENEENVDRLISLAPNKKARHIKVKSVFK